MAFNVETFKAEFKPLRGHSFETSIPKIAGFDRIYTESINLPGFSFMSADNYKPYGNGKTYTIPYAHNFQEISCTHMIDVNGELYSKYYSWVNSIVGLRPSRFFSPSYHKSYSNQDMSILVYNPQGNLVKTINLKEAYPVSMDQIPLSWGDNDSVAKMNVTYRYTWYDVN